MQLGSFTTQQAPANQSLRLWQDAMERHSKHGFVIKPVGRGPFRAWLQSYHSSRHRLVMLSMSSHEAICDTMVLRRKRSQAITLVLLKTGSAKVTQDGREAVLAASDLVLINTIRPLVIEAAEVEVLTLDLDPAKLIATLPAAEAMTCVRIAGTSKSGGFLRSALLHLFELAEETSDAALDHLIDAISHIVAATFCEQAKPSQILPRSSDALLRHRIQLAIRNGLKNPDLCPALIAAQVGISERYLHKLFNQNGRTLMAYAWSQRLCQSRIDLENPALQRLPISEIAQRWGFKSAAHFSRAFKKEFGHSASDVRMNIAV